MSELHAVRRSGSGTCGAGSPTGDWRRPSRRELAYRLVLRAIRVLLRICTRIHRAGLDNLPADGPVIVAGNHCSVADGFVLVSSVACAGRRARMMGTAGLFAAPVVGSLLRHAGFIPVHRRSVNPAAALAPARAALAAGECVGLYPEGTITRHTDGWPARARTGVVRLALDTGAPVVPLAQWGTREFVGEEGTRHRALWSPLTRPRIRVLVGRPIDLRAELGVSSATQASAAQLRAGADLVMDQLCRALESLTEQERPSHAGRAENPAEDLAPRRTHAA